jgi:hypothetical protein
MGVSSESASSPGFAQRLCSRLSGTVKLLSIGALWVGMMCWPPLTKSSKYSAFAPSPRMRFVLHTLMEIAFSVLITLVPFVIRPGLELMLVLAAGSLFALWRQFVIETLWHMRSAGLRFEDLGTLLRKGKHKAGLRRTSFRPGGGARRASQQAGAGGRHERASMALARRSDLAEWNKREMKRAAANGEQEGGSSDTEDMEGGPQKSPRHRGSSMDTVESDDTAGSDRSMRAESHGDAVKLMIGSSLGEVLHAASPDHRTHKSAPPVKTQGMSPSEAKVHAPGAIESPPQPV